jgi:hypothetical protein
MKSLVLSLPILLFPFISIQAQPTTTNLSQARAQMGSVIHGSKVYFGGGILSSGGHSDMVEIYDIDAEPWETQRLSIARSFPSAVAVGTKVLFAGGINFNTLQEYTTVDIYDTLTRTWSVAELSAPGFYLQAVSHENTILLAGFQELVSQSPLTMTFSNAVNIYDAATGNWRTDTLSQARGAMSATVVGDMALFAGGQTSPTTTSNRVDIYHFTTGTWSTASLSEARAYTAAVTVANKAIFAGGVSAGDTQSDVVDIYDYDTNEWSTTRLSAPRSFSTNQGVTACGRAYFVGGATIDLPNFNSTAASDVVDIYEVSSDTWSVDTLSNPILNHAVAALQNQIIVAGGVFFTPAITLTDLVEIYSCGEVTETDEPHGTDADLKVFPNPAGDFMYLMVDHSNWLGSQLEVFDMNGSLVKRDKIRGPSTLIDLSELRAGAYALRISNRDQAAVRRIIKAANY